MNYYNSIIESINYDKEICLPSNIDLVISGGGLGCYYNLIVIIILYKLVKLKKLNIRYIYSVSAGSILSVILLCMIYNENFILDADKLREQYDLLKVYTNDNKNNTLLDNMELLLRSILPSNAHEICSSRLYITVNKVSVFGIYRENISTFHTFDDLMNIIRCSSSVPFCSINGLFTKYKDAYYFDGILPLYKKNEYSILYIEYLIMFYKHLFKPNDDNIDKLIENGYNEFMEFLYNNKKSKRFYLL